MTVILIPFLFTGTAITSLFFALPESTAFHTVIQTEKKPGQTTGVDMEQVAGMDTEQVAGADGRIIGSPQNQRPDLRFEKIDHGLTSSQVLSILHDSYGYLWVGTYSGLNRYNGITFDSFRSTDETGSLADNQVGIIYEDRNRQLWIGGRSSLSRYCRQTDRFFLYDLPEIPEGVTGASTIVQSIEEDHEGRLWVAGGSNGLYYYDKESDSFRIYEPLTTHIINTVLPDGEGGLWAATGDKGLQHIRPETGEISTYRSDSTVTLNKIHMVRDHEGDIWITTLNSGLIKVSRADDSQVQIQRYYNIEEQPKVLENNLTYSIHVDRQGRLWVGNDNGGLHLYDRDLDLFHHYDSDPVDPRTLSHHSISAIHQDHEERLWIGTALSGLNVMDPYVHKFEHHHTASRFNNNLTNNIIRGFQEDEQGNIWIATDGGGLNYFDRESGYFTSYRHDPGDPESIQSDAVTSIKKDSDRTLWVGSYDGGLDLLIDKDAGRFVSIQDTFDLQGHSIENPYSIHFDKQHPWVWIAEFRNGVIRLDTEAGEVAHFEPVPGDPSSVSSEFVIHIFEDSNHNLWFSSFNGLNVLASENKENGQFQRFLPDHDDPGSIPGLEIRQVTEDRTGRIWIATENGLAKYEPETGSFKNWFESDGLPDNNLQSVIEDDHGNLWIGSLGGLTRFTPETNTFENFGPDDGLQSYEFSRYSNEKLTTGELLAGGMNGFNLFHPDEISYNPVIPPVFITDLKLFNESVSVDGTDSPLDRHISVTDTVHLSYRDNVISFDFIALNYTRAEQNQYAYMMEGFESEWNYVGNRRNATYTNLNPGTYRFRVKASNNDGIWNETGTSVILHIIPPFWQTTWFYAVLILFAVLVILFAYRLKVAGYQKKNRQLEEMVEHRTTELRQTNEQLNRHIEEKNKIYSVLGHDLRNPFMSMMGLSEYLIEKFRNDSDKENLEIASSILSGAQNSYNLLENLLYWSEANNRERKANREQIPVKTLIDETVSMAGLQAGMKEVSIVNKTDASVYVKADRNMVQTVLRNLISNAIKFSHKKGTVTIQTDIQDQQVFIAIADQGTGMDEKTRDRLFSHMSTGSIKGTLGEQGSGFGLMICKEFVERNGGQIWVESEPGKGSRFIFSLERVNVPETSDK